MTSIAIIRRNRMRIEMSKKDFSKRLALKNVVKLESESGENKIRAMIKLAKMSRNSSRVRIVNRCSVTGRAHGVASRLGISRLILRELVATGCIPGIIKSSW